MDEQQLLFMQMVRECSGVYDMFAILETLVFIAPQGVTHEQVISALNALQPKAA